MATQAQANAFANNPSAFLGTAIVRWAGGAPQDQQIINVAMLDDGQGRRREAGIFGGKVDASKFMLRHAFAGNAQVPGGSPTFAAVWSGYVGGQARKANLPAAGGPDIMLTPELTGCAVVCRVNPDGSAQFSHYNLADEGANQTLDRATMNAIAEAEYGGGQNVFAKEDYRALGKRSQNVRVTVVGQRAPGGWQFWGQIREDKASGQQLRQVRRLG